MDKKNDRFISGSIKKLHACILTSSMSHLHVYIYIFIHDLIYLTKNCFLEVEGLVGFRPMASRWVFQAMIPPGSLIIDFAVPHVSEVWNPRIFRGSYRSPRDPWESM